MEGKGMRMKRYLLAFASTSCVLVILCNMTFSSKEGAAAPSTLGKAISDFTLPDTKGQEVALASFKDKQAIVVVFIGTECPINNAFMPRLVQLSGTYGPKGVQFLAINSNHQDDAQRVAQHARENELPFPVLKDDANVVADQFGAERTPEAFVLDARRAIRYRGRIDDQFGIGYTRAKPTSNDLAIALDEVLAGKKVTQPLTQVAGCFIARTAKPKAEAQITFTKDVARIMQKNCQECHRKGQIGPMSLITYESVSAWAESILGKLNEDQLQKMLNTEFGGMPEVMADLYADTGDRRWLELSHRLS